MLTALETRPQLRLVIVGGAASLEVKPGLVFSNSDELLHAAIDGFGLPREYAAAMRGHGDALNLYRTSNRLWTYLSPAVAVLDEVEVPRFVQRRFTVGY